MDGSPWSYEALPKAVLYAAVACVIGTIVTRWLLIRLGSASLSAQVPGELERTLLGLGRVAAGVVLAALLARVIAHTAVVFGSADTLRWDNLRVVAIESRWGQAWQLQAFTAGVLLMSTLTIRLGRRAGWLVFSLVAFTLCATIPRLGHGATSGGSLLLHTLHLAAISVWLGTLAVIVMLFLIRPEVRSAMASVIPIFSVVALPSAALTIVTGVIAAFIYVGSFAHLVDTLYGRTLLMKIAAFAGVLSLGWRNWRRVRKGESPRRRSLIAELVCAAAVVLITSVLTEMDHP